MVADLSDPQKIGPAAFDHGVESFPLHQDAAQEDAVHALAALFSEHRDRVFYGKQLEALFERDYFHWVTNRAYRELIDRGLVLEERRTLTSGIAVRIMWDRRFRYPRRAVERLAALIDEYECRPSGPLNLDPPIDLGERGLMARLGVRGC